MRHWSLGSKRFRGFFRFRAGRGKRMETAATERAEDRAPLSPPLAACDRWEQEDLRGGRHRGVEPAEQADVVAVHEDVQVAGHALAVEHAALQRRMLLDELGQRLAHRSGVRLDGAVAAGVGTQHRWDADLSHVTSKDKASGRGRCHMFDNNLRILIAEDETIIRLDLRRLLEREGFEVCAEARDGEEAVALARETRPDLALLDVKMPALDGIEAARRIYAERPIPIVMLTAYADRALVSRAVEAGVFGYLVKPFRETDLLPAIATATARHDELRALREEADSLAEALAARKAIERAKGILMEREGLSESEAFARLRKASQIS